MLRLHGSLNRPRLVLLLALALAGSASPAAYAEPVGSEFSTPVISTGSGLAYGSGPSPGWLTAGPGILEATGAEIFSSRITPGGTLVPGSPGQVSLSDQLSPPEGSNHDDPQAPSLAYNTQRDEFLAVWAEGFVIWGRVLDGDATPLGDPFQISDGADHYVPKAVYNPDRDEYMVVWEEDSEGSADKEMQVQVQRLDGEGQELTPDDVQISSNPTLDDAGPQGLGFGQPQIAYNHASGGYLVTWSPTYSLDPADAGGCPAARRDR